MARPKKFKNSATCSFKLERETLGLLKDLAASCGQTVSDFLSEYVEGLTAANKAKIDRFRRQKNQFAKPTFTEPALSKKARPSKKKSTVAQVADSPTNEGDVTNAEKT